MIDRSICLCQAHTHGRVRSWCRGGLSVRLRILRPNCITTTTYICPTRMKMPPSSPELVLLSYLAIITPFAVTSQALTHSALTLHDSIPAVCCISTPSRKSGRIEQVSRKDKPCRLPCNTLLQPNHVPAPPFGHLQRRKHNHRIPERDHATGAAAGCPTNSGPRAVGTNHAMLFDAQSLSRRGFLTVRSTVAGETRPILSCSLSFWKKAGRENQCPLVK